MTLMEEAKEEGVLCTFAKTTQVHHYQVYFRYIIPKNVLSLVCTNRQLHFIYTKYKNRILNFIIQDA